MARGTEVVEGRDVVGVLPLFSFLENRNGGYCHRVSALMKVSIICTCVQYREKGGVIESY